MKDEIAKRLRELYFGGMQEYNRPDVDVPEHTFHLLAAAAQIGYDFALEECGRSMDTRIKAAWDRSAELEREECARLLRDFDLQHAADLIVDPVVRRSK